MPRCDCDVCRSYRSARAVALILAACAVALVVLLVVTT